MKINEIRKDLTATQLITNDQPWEGAVTEAPWMIRQNGFFYLFYSFVFNNNFTQLKIKLN